MNASNLEEQIADGFADRLESIRIINDDEDDDVSHLSFVDRVVGNEGRLEICSSSNLPQACHLFTIESHLDLVEARVDAIVSPATPSQCHFRLHPVERLQVWASSACNQIPLVSFPIPGAAPKDAKFKGRQSDINTQPYLRKETMLSIRSTSPVRMGPNWIDDEESTTTAAAAAAHANLNTSLHSHDSFVSAAFVPRSTPFLFSLNALSSTASAPVSLEDFPDDLIIHIASFLNVKSLIQARLTNRRFCSILSHNEAGWSDHCYTLWKRKIHCDPVARHLLIQSFPKTEHPTELPNVCSSTAALQAYQLSCMDGRLRHEITRQELCYDVTSTDFGFAATASNVSHGNGGTIWSFRFKDSAGTGWTEHDPWHRGGEARQMVFLQNGTVRQLANDRSSSNHDSIDLRLPFYDTPDASGGIDIQWRYVSQPMDLPKRNDGAYIRLTVGGRDVPTYLVRRSPTGNWGFLMENCWGVFASFQLPLKQSQRTIQPPTAGFVSSSSTPTAAGATVPCTPRRQKRSRSQSPTRQVRMRLRRLSNGDGIWLNVSDIESESEDEDDGTNIRNNGRVQASTSRRAIGRANNVITNPQSNNINNNLGSSSADWLLGDDFSVVTSRWQWREALYYNLGAITLPDGPVAIAEIQR